jgi:hypothetical protein
MKTSITLLLTGILLSILYACVDPEVRKTETGSAPSTGSQPALRSVQLEGTIKYSYGISTPERPGFTGYILEQWHWVAGPMISSGVVHLEGNIVGSVRDKLVRIFGNVTHDDLTPQSSSVTVEVDSVQILN